MLSISRRDSSMSIPMNKRGIPSIPSILELSLSLMRYQRCFPESHQGRRKIKVDRVAKLEITSRVVMPCSMVASSFI